MGDTPKRPDWLWKYNWDNLSGRFVNARSLATVISYIEHLEAESSARMDSIRHLRDERTELSIKIMELEEQLGEARPMTKPLLLKVGKNDWRCSCGTWNLIAERKCWSCGYELCKMPERKEGWLCPRCGFNNMPNVRACGQCREARPDGKERA